MWYTPHVYSPEFGIQTRASLVVLGQPRVPARRLSTVYLRTGVSNETTTLESLLRNILPVKQGIISDKNRSFPRFPVRSYLSRLRGLRSQ